MQTTATIRAIIEMIFLLQNSGR